VKRLLLMLALGLGGCGQGEQARVLLLDPAWTAEVAATMDAGFVAPDGLHWADGSLWLADEAGSAVRRWRPGAPAQTLLQDVGGRSSPEDIVRDAAGNLYVTDDNLGGVRRIGADGRVTTIARAEQGLPSTEGLAIGPDGTLYVGDGEAHRVVAIGPDGRTTELVGPAAGIGKPESLALDPAGNLYIADNDAAVLYLLTPEGTLRTLLRGVNGFSPESIAWVGDALYITDSDHGILHHYHPDRGLRPIAGFVGALANVQGVSGDGASGLFVSVRSGPDERHGYLLRLRPAAR
jgi:sugar lactone lactonase YvrE